MPPGTILGHISAIEINHQSIQRMPTDARDQWNMHAVNIMADVTLPNGRRASRSILGKSGSPLHAFTGDSMTWSGSTVVEGEPAEICFTRIAESIDLTVDSWLQQTGAPPAAPVATIAHLPGASATGVDSVETSAYTFGLGGSATLDTDFRPTGDFGFGDAPEDGWVWPATGICSRHNATGFAHGDLTGNGPGQDC